MHSEMPLFPGQIALESLDDHTLCLALLHSHTAHTLNKFQFQIGYLCEAVGHSCCQVLTVDSGGLLPGALQLSSKDMLWLICSYLTVDSGATIF